MMTALKRFHTCTATVCAPNPAAGHQQPKPFLESPGHSQASLLWGHRSFLLGPGAQGSVVPSKNQFPILCKFWQLYGGVNGDLLQEDLCHTHTQSPHPCSTPLLTCTSTGDAHSSVSVSVGSLGPGVHKVCLSPLSISGGNGCIYILLRLPLHYIKCIGKLENFLACLFVLIFSHLS